jgi:ACS family sodium-dependent inorganic phosphate cotransporter-like MFS transporter 5
MSESDKEYIDQTLFTMTLMSKTCKWILTLIPLRVWVVALLFLCVTVTTLTRVNVSLAVVSMTVDLSLYENDDNSSLSATICPTPQKEIEPWIDIDIVRHPNIKIEGLDVDNLASSIIPSSDDNDSGLTLRNRVYAWSASTQSNIYGAFFWSYFPCLIPSGIFYKKLGGRLIVSMCLLGSALISFNIPLITDFVAAFITMRFMLGVVQAGLFPACFAIICNWIPLEERSVCFALIDVGSNCGAIILFMVSGWLEHLWGWPALYFVPGLFSFMTFFLAVNCIREKPEKDSIDCLKNLQIKRQKEMETTNTKELTSEASVPLTAILLNPSVLACGFFKFACCWNIVIVSSKIPTYLKVILHQDLSSNGYTNAAIYFLVAASLTMTGAFSDKIINRGILSRTRCRKAFSLVSGFGVAITLLLIPIAGCCPYTLHAVLFLNSICCGFVGGSDAALPGEMTTKYPAALFSIINTMGDASALFAPVFAGFLLDSMQDQWHAWCVVFLSSALLLIIAEIVFLIFVSAERQSFDYIDAQKKEPC